MTQSFKQFAEELAKKGKNYVSRTNEIYDATGNFVTYDTTESDGLILRITRKISPNTPKHRGYGNICGYCINKSECTNRWLPHNNSEKCPHMPYHNFVSVQIIGKTLARQFADEREAHKTQLSALNAKLQTLEQQETQKNQLLTTITNNNIALSNEMVGLKRDIGRLITLITQ